MGANDKSEFDFEWSSHAFRGGEAENKQMLNKFEKIYDDMIEKAADGSSDVSLETLLMKGLDLAVAFVKNYELDKADALYEKIMPQVREIGLPLIAKGLQDMATLRFKQNRQAEGAIFLEELRDMMPPHPTIYHNLGTTYNSLGRHDDALHCFEFAIALKEANGNYEKDYSDYWDLGLVYKNLGRIDEAIENMEKAYKLCPKEDDDIVMVAKIHDSLGSTYLEAGQYEKSQIEYQKGLDLFREALGDYSPLVGTAAEMLAKSYIDDEENKEKLYENSKPALQLALQVQAHKDAIHPTPLFQILDGILKVYMDTNTTKELPVFHQNMNIAWTQLCNKGLGDDANAGIVRHKMAMIYLFSGNEYSAEAVHQMIEARDLVKTGPPELIADPLDMIEQHLSVLISVGRQ